MSSENKNIESRILSFATTEAVGKIIGMNRIAGRYEGIEKSLNHNRAFVNSFAAALKGLKEEITELEEAIHFPDRQKEFADVLHYVFHIWHLLDLFQEVRHQFRDPESKNNTTVSSETYPCQAYVLRQVAQQNLESKFTKNKPLVELWKDWWEKEKSVPCEIVGTDDLFAVVATEHGIYNTRGKDGVVHSHQYHKGKFLKSPNLVRKEDFSNESDNSD